MCPRKLNELWPCYWFISDLGTFILQTCTYENLKWGGGGKEGGEDTAGWMCAQIPHTQTQRHRCTYHSFRAVSSSSTGSWWQGGIRTVVTSWTQWTHWRSCTAVCTWSQSGKYVMYHHHELCMMVVVAFSSLARVLGECLTIHSPPALLFFLKWRLAHLH